MIPCFSLWFPVFFGSIALKWCQHPFRLLSMILSFKLKLIILLQKKKKKERKERKKKKDFLGGTLFLYVVPSCFLVPSHWNGVNSLTGSFSMILSFKLRTIIWLKKIDGTLFFYVVPCVFLFLFCFLFLVFFIFLFHCIEIVSIPSQVPFPWFGNLNWT